MNNNFRTPSGRSFANYLPNSYDRNRPSIPLFPRLSTPPSPDGTSGAAYYPWPSAEQSIITGPLGFMGLSLQPPPNLQILVLNNRPQQASTSTQEGSRLTQDEQIDAIKKLKKEIYNPVPKRLSSRLCLYYRDQAPNIVKERAKEIQEDGKRCAVCLEDFEPRETVMVTPCNHMFHEECILPWVKSHGQCPVCRFSIWEPTGRSSVNNFPNVAPNSDLLTGGDLLSILRAMGAM